MIPIAPAAFARVAFDTNVQIPRETSTILPASDPGGSFEVSCSGAFAGPHKSRSIGLPSVPVIVVTSMTCWSAVTQVVGIVLGPFSNGICAPPTCGAETWRIRPKTWLFETAATEIASGAVPGEPTVPSPKSSRSLPAAITGTTPAATTFVIVSISASLTGSVCGPPPEKLITFMPSATADSKAAMISGVSAISPPSGVGTLNTR